MGLDIRLPIGALFTLLGAILTLYGALGDAAQYQRSLGYNVNLFWGILLLVFGLVMFYFGRRGTSAMRPASTTPEGRAIEEMEHRTGKESED
jgi:sulfite exporter TauE/SafE